jgi:pimeloyl-ACP methyl ester carboxylesterase
VAACESGERAKKGAFRPSFKAAPCPPDVLPQIADFRSCGYVTVLEDRSKPEGPTVRLFVTRVEPPSGHPRPDPMLRLGHDLAWQPDYGGIAPLADRVNREVVILDERGVGHSEPSLSCPEVDTLRSSALGVSTGNPRLLPTLLDAVRACRGRLVRAGVELSAYNLAEMAADVEDVRIALGIGRWNLQTGGTWSTVLFEVMRRYPEHVRTVTFDSPDVPQVDLLTEAIIGTRYAMANLARACRRAPACQRAFPDLEGALRNDLLRLRQAPARVHAGNQELTVLDSTMIRLIRGWLSATELLPTLPSAIYSLQAEARRGGGTLASLIADQPVLSLGYAGLGPRTAFSYGTFYSVLCHDELPFVDRQVLRELAGDDPWYADAYVNNPYFDVCERWDVGKAATDPHRLVTSDIPTLLAVGQFDAFAPLPLVQEAAERLSTSWVVEIPDWGHNVFGSECALAIRNAWIDDPSSPPDTSCTADMNTIEFEEP